jgi:hypothetical protein
MVLTTQDVTELKAILDQAILKNIGVRKLKNLPAVRTLSPQAQHVLNSLTSREIHALASVYKKAKRHGAKNKDLACGPFF